ncbi:Fe/S biogenesis protein NfuA [bioreactor metagenome]|uniref:Fe/S biogenesis protein NfuA n=1 Tax=bioreactor metagenome TaxID=1076179 RepID=A0A645B9L5_9ZZZZ
MNVSTVEKAINTHVNPKLREHGGWIELVGLNDGMAEIRFRGACSGCAGIQKTLDEIVVPLLKEHVPALKGVQLNEEISPELYRLALGLLTKK